jgi:RNA polymerase sigma factor (sigma-70 family)
MIQRIIMAEDKLIEAIQMKSRAGAVALYDMYSHTLYGIIVRIVKHKEMAEDICQEAFIKIWDSIGKYNVSKGRLFTWMSCLARNMAKDALRSRQYHEYVNTTTLEDHVEDKDKNRLNIFNTDTLGVKRWTEKLHKDQKDIIDLIYFKGYTHMEVATELDVPLGTVKSRCRKGISILRTIYNDMKEIEQAKFPAALGMVS